jgi:hypothetical protein
MIGECRGWMPVMGGLKQRGQLVKRKGVSGVDASDGRAQAKGAIGKTERSALFLGQSVCANVLMSHDHHLSKYAIIFASRKDVTHAVTL